MYFVYNFKIKKMLFNKNNIPTFKSIDSSYCITLQYNYTYAVLAPIHKTHRKKSLT